MFKGCTIKYNKSPITGQNCSIQVTYPANDDGSVNILSVPLVEDNTDYQNILKWVEEGNTIEEAD